MRRSVPAIACLLLLAAACRKDPVPAPRYAGKPVKVDLYVMSQCPYGVSAEQMLFPLVERFGDAVELRLGFVGGVEHGEPRSLHGASEVQGDLAQICAAKRAPDRWRAVVSCMNDSPGAIPGNWEGCASKAGVDVAAVRGCMQGEEGRALLLASFQEADGRQVQGSPTLYVDGREYRGPMAERDVLRGICHAFGDPPPAACAGVPPVVAVPVKILADRRCTDCPTDEIVGALGGVFPGLEPTVLDWSDPEARRLAGEAGIRRLPAFLFDGTVEKGEGYAQVKEYLKPAGSWRSLEVGAEWDPTAEICGNGVDDSGDGQSDCADPACADHVSCRPEEALRLDLFVMSQCPYGVKALDALKEVLPVFPEVKLGVHFLVGTRPDGSIASLHGQEEIDEDIREMCAIQHYPQGRKYMEYIWCRNTGMATNADWKTCTGASGIDLKVMEACSTGAEGKALLVADAALGNRLGIDASPTWLVNNRHLAQAIDAADIQQAICAHNQLPGCAKPLSHGPAGEAGGCAH